MRTHRMRLPDGRMLAYCEYGRAHGQPLFLFHGAPGSRLPIAGTARIADHFGYRVIAPDRPGYGRSDPHPRRKLLDWADDITVLANHLELRRFAVAGRSAGAPHAAACAWRLADRVTSTVLISCPPPAGSPGVSATLSAVSRRMGMLARRAPRAIRLSTGALALGMRVAPQETFRLITSHLGPADRRLLTHRDRRETLMQQYREAYRQGGAAHAQDLRLVSEPWGFDPSQIASELFLWHGCGDRIVPTAAARLLHARMPQGRLHELAHAGHLLLENPQCWRGMLRELRAAEKGAAPPGTPRAAPSGRG